MRETDVLSDQQIGKMAKDAWLVCGIDKYDFLLLRIVAVVS